MQAGNWIRIGVNMCSSVVDSYSPDANTTAFDSQRLTWFQKRELKKAIAGTLASLDEVFSQVM